MKISKKRLKEIINEELDRIYQIDEYRDEDEETHQEQLSSRRPGSKKCVKKQYVEEKEV